MKPIISRLIAITALGFHCAGQGSIEDGKTDSVGNVSLNISEIGAPTISSGTIEFTLKGAGAPSIKTFKYPITTKVSFENIVSGSYVLTVKVYEGDYVRLQGEVNVQVVGGQITQAMVPLNWTTGSVQITLTYPNLPVPPPAPTCVGQVADLFSIPPAPYITKGQVTFDSVQGMKVVENATDVYAGLYRPVVMSPNGSLKFEYRTKPVLGSSAGSPYTMKGMSLTGPNGVAIWIGNLNDAWMSTNYGQPNGWGMRVVEASGYVYSQVVPHNWNKLSHVTVEVNSSGYIRAQRVMLDGTVPNLAVVEYTSPRLASLKSTGGQFEFSLRDYLWWTATGGDHSLFSSLVVTTCPGPVSQAASRSISPVLQTNVQALVGAMKLSGQSMINAVQYKFFAAWDESASGGTQRTLNSWSDIDQFGLLVGISTTPLYTATLESARKYFGAIVAVDSMGNETLYSANWTFTAQCPTKNADVTYPSNPGLVTAAMDANKVVYIDYTMPSHGYIKSAYQFTVQPQSVVRLYTSLPIAEANRLFTQVSDQWGMFIISVGDRCRPLTDKVYVTSQVYGYQESTPIVMTRPEWAD